MDERFTRDLTRLMDSVSALCGVRAIGKSGGEAFPQDGEGDVDIYIFCYHVPGAAERETAILKIGDGAEGITISQSPGRFWGTIDFLTLHGVEMCLMYFDIADMDAEIEAVLNGSRLDKEGGYFYPTGRCATFLTMHALHDPDEYIAGMRRRLSDYPPELSRKLFEHHARKIDDPEDFERAITRGDALFYHAALEAALDHFLQALFARNRCFFPSRKRSVSYIERFEIAPPDCAARLLKAVELGARPETLAESYRVWRGLCEELNLLKE